MDKIDQGFKRLQVEGRVEPNKVTDLAAPMVPLWRSIWQAFVSVAIMVLLRIHSQNWIIFQYSELRIFHKIIQGDKIFEAWP